MDKKKYINHTIEIPSEVRVVVETLIKAGFEAYVVGGSVRDILLARRSLDGGGRREKPKDWDITTSARPEDILRLFPASFYENKFLTVTVKTESKDPTVNEVEVTTFRAEGGYMDKRHPDKIQFANTLEEDLSRRDFTINAIALDLTSSDFKILDPFSGQADLEKKIIRAVGEPEVRLNEDALRMIRAVRFAVELGFEIDEKTRDAAMRHAGNLEFIAKERIRDELIKILMLPRAREGIELLHVLGLLKYIIPELEEGIGIENRPKIFTVWAHNLKALEYGSKTGFPLDVRIAAMLHDAGKPRTKGPMKNNEWTFYGHDLEGAKIATQVLSRLRFSHDKVEKIATLIRWHLFKYDPNEGITDSSVRRLIRRVGAEHMNDLVRLRICDRMGMGVPKALPYRLRHFQFRVEKILREEEAPSPKMLKINGDDIMRILNIPPSQKVGHILEVLLQEVIDDPSKNSKENLESKIYELGKLSDKELVRIADEAESKVELGEDERISSIKARYFVK